MEVKGRLMFNGVLTTLDMEVEKQGIIIPENSAKAYTDQRVVKVGENVDNLKEGEVVEINPAVLQRGVPILKLEGVEYALISVRDILYVYPKDYKMKHCDQDSRLGTDKKEVKNKNDNESRGTGLILS